MIRYFIFKSINSYGIFYHFVIDFFNLITYYVFLYLTDLERVCNLFSDSKEIGLFFGFVSAVEK